MSLIVGGELAGVRSWVDKPGIRIHRNETHLFFVLRLGAMVHWIKYKSMIDWYLGSRNTFFVCEYIVECGELLQLDKTIMWVIGVANLITSLGNQIFLVLLTSIPNLLCVLPKHVICKY